MDDDRESSECYPILAHRLPRLIVAAKGDPSSIVRLVCLRRWIYRQDTSRKAALTLVESHSIESHILRSIAFDPDANLLPGGIEIVVDDEPHSHIDGSIVVILDPDDDSVLTSIAVIEVGALQSDGCDG